MLLPLLLAGCASLTPDAYASRLRIEQGLADTGLGKGLYISSLIEAPVADGTLKVGVSGGSTLQQPLSVRYKVFWYDRSGIVVRTAVTNWEHLNIAALGAFDISFVGPGPQAVRYLIEWQYD